ncbi:MAG: DUF5683 domain-containing protein [Candidatus Zixiibacteriota bacterium]
MAARLLGMMCIIPGLLIGPALANSVNFPHTIPSIIAAVDDTIKPAEELSIPDTLTITSDTIQPVWDVNIGDTVILTPTPYVAGTDTSVINAYLTENYTPLPKRSPSTTMLKSVVFPGWGQYSNKKYIKAGVIFAVESYFIYKAVDYGIKAGDSRDYWKSLPDSLATEKAAAFRTYTNDRDNRNSNIWYTVIVTFLSMIDAYVDAHLRDFPETKQDTDKLSLDVMPGDETRVALVLRF